jgi:hypothetical protein
MNASVAVAVGGAFLVTSAITVWADWVWTMLKSWVGAVVAGGVPQALMIRLRAANSARAAEIRFLVWFFIITLYFSPLEMDCSF